MGVVALVSQLFVWVLLVVIEVFIHVGFKYVTKSRPNYLLWFIIRGMAAIVQGGLAFNVQDTFVDWWPLLMFQVFSHYTIFNPLHSILSKFFDPNISFWYLGKHSGYIDSMFIKSPVLYRLFYFGCVAATIFSIIKLTQYYL